VEGDPIFPALIEVGVALEINHGVKALPRADEADEDGLGEVIVEVQDVLLGVGAESVDKADRVRGVRVQVAEIRVVRVGCEADPGRLAGDQLAVREIWV
jgi:hypothetical protein